MTSRLDDTVQQWLPLLEELPAKGRDAVAQSLCQHAGAGRTDTVESVRLLVAYAAGRIDSRTYAKATLKTLGFDPVDCRFDEPVPAPAVQIERPPATRESRKSAVQAYVTGRISVEDFLRVVSDR